MNLNTDLFKELLEKAKENPQLRKAMNLRTTDKDKSLRLLNALMPGTQEHIHQHMKSAETAIILSGEIDEMYTTTRVTRPSATRYV